MELMDMLERPAIFVKEGLITRVNSAGILYSHLVGQELSCILGNDMDTYRRFDDGVLYISLCVEGKKIGAAIIRTDEEDIIFPENEYTEQGLQALSLAAMHLRTQLSSIMAVAQEKSMSAKRKTKAEQLQDGQINRGLFRMQRMVANMSDISRYRKTPPALENLEICSVIEEIIEKAAVLLKESGIHLTYSLPHHAIFTLANYEMIERAIYNLISNAVKFSYKEGGLEISLKESGNHISLTVSDNGAGIADDLYSTLFTRYLRSPTLEDGLYGIGLGMALVQTVAAAHNGTILVHRPISGGTKVTMTIAIQEPAEDILRSPRISLVDYAGGYDHGLVELSDVAPPQLYIGKF